MAAFEYQALDAEGRTQKGVLEADTARSARSALRERGLTPLEVEPVAERSIAANPLAMGTGRLRNSELALLLRELATMVDAGLPVDEALGALADQSQKPRVMRPVLALRARVREGATLAEAMAVFPESFPELVRSAVAAGEHSGQLGPSLMRLADYTERRADFARQLVAALAYPVLLSCVAVIIVIGLLTYVVPQVVHVFENLGGRLPLLTRVLIVFAALLKSYGLVALALLAVAAVGARAALARPELRSRWHALMLRLPVLGRLLRATDTARVTRTLSMLASSGVPLLDALKLAVKSARMLPMSEALARAALRVREGQSFARALADTGQFPPVALRLIGSGEKSGRLEQMLDAAAEHESREVEARLSALGAIVGPLVILFVGGMVLLIVLAILLPIFQMNSMIR